MPKEISATLRSAHTIKSIHIWTGLILGLVVSVVCLTGSVIVFRDDVRQAAIPKSTSAPDAPRIGLDDLAKQVAAAGTDVEIRRVRMPLNPGDRYMVQLTSDGQRQNWAFDASTGHFVAAVQSGWVDWMVDLHRNLLAGKTGRKAVGVVGIALLALGVSGVVMWLIGARRWSTWFSVRTAGSSRRLYFDVHRTTGLWASAMLTVFAFTGVGLAYPQTIRQALQWVTGQPGAVVKQAPPKAEVSGLRPLDEYLRVGQAAMPEGIPVELRLPEGDKGLVDLRVRRQGDLASDGNHVYLDPSTASVLSVMRLAEQPLAARISASFSPIHYGEFGGFAIKAIWAVIGVTPSLLYITGLLVWWKPKRKAAASAPLEVEQETAVLVGR